MSFDDNISVNIDDMFELDETRVMVQPARSAVDDQEIMALITRIKRCKTMFEAKCVCGSFVDHYHELTQARLIDENDRAMEEYML